MIRTTASAALLLAGLALTAAPSDGQTRVDRQAECAAWNGHFQTYDGYRFDDYTPDVVWLITDDRNVDHPFRVEVETAPYSHVAFFRRAAVRCGESILVADAGTDRNVFLLDGQELAPGETPFGVQGDRANLSGDDPQGHLQVQCGERSVSFTTGMWNPGRILMGVKPRLTHYLQGGEPTAGLCGPFDGNTANDQQMVQDRTRFQVPMEQSLFAQVAPPTPAEIPGAIYTHPGVLEFDGTNNLWLDGPYRLTPNFHVRADVLVHSSDQWDHLIEIGSHPYEWNGPFRLEVGNEGEWYVSVGDGAGYSELYQPGSWRYGEWVTIEVEYKGGAIRIWENGQYLGVKQADIDVTAVGGELNLGHFARGGRNFHGALRNVVIQAID